MNDGWIKLHRSILDWEWHDDPNTFCLWIHLLLMANHDEQKWHGMAIPRGSLLTSREKLADISKLSTQNVRTSLKKLTKSQNLTIKSTKQYTLITICNYNTYQDNQTDYQPTNQPTINQRLTNNQPTTNQQLTINKNIRMKENNISLTTARTREEEESEGIKSEGINYVDVMAGDMMVDVEVLYAEYREELAGETMVSDSAVRMARSKGVELTREDVAGYLDLFQDKTRLSGTKTKTRGDYRRHFSSWFALMVGDRAKKEENENTNNRNSNYYGTTRTDNNQRPAKIADASQFVDRL